MRFSDPTAGALSQAGTGTVGGTEGADSTGGGGSAGGGGTAAEQPTSSAFDDIDRLVEILEERLLNELERRGARFRGGF